ncbi:MAG: hypothetical protein OEZ23_04815 [Gammaproteobacteria bacterium]|nr:hypothetical protein [Gammaproteobacteria bacterium]
MNFGHFSFWQLTGQLIAYGLFVVFIGVFADYPLWSHSDHNEAEIKLSINHAGQLKMPCRKRSAEELAELAPNMRSEMVCSRERSDLVLQMLLNEKMVYSKTIEAGGIGSDGEASAYARLKVDAGDYHLQVRMKDDANTDGFNYHLDQNIHLESRQVMVVQFNKLKGGFVLR